MNIKLYSSFTIVCITLLFNLPLQAQEDKDSSEVFLDIQVIKKQLAKSKAIQTNDLCGKTWEVQKAYMQIIFEGEEADTMSMNFPFEGYTYTFDQSGTFHVGAIIDSNGDWEFRENGKAIYLYNHLRKDEEIHHIILHDDHTMEWYLIEEKDNSIVYQVLKVAE